MKLFTWLKQIMKRDTSVIEAAEKPDRKRSCKRPFEDITAKQFLQYYKAIGGIRTDELGDIICSHCGTHFITEDELVVSGFGNCPRCGKEWFIFPEVAEWINRINAERQTCRSAPLRALGRRWLIEGDK